MSENSHSRTKPLWYLTAASALILGGVTAWLLLSRPVEISAVLLPNPRAIAPDIELLHATGPRSAADLFAGNINYVFFGFTNCPDICPITLQKMAATLSKANPDQTTPRMVFVSVDPERDDPTTVQAYADYFDPRIVGVTASPDGLAGLAEALGVAIHIQYHEPGQPYSVDHSAGIFLVDNNSRYRGMYRPPHDAEQLTGEFGAIRKSLAGAAD